MKKALTLLIFFGWVITISAQQRTCGMEQHMQQLLQDPAYALQHQEKLDRIAEMTTAIPLEKELCANPVRLPIAVHFQGVNNPNVNCLRALAQNQIDILNDDLQGNNADITNWTNNASTFFSGLDNGNACIEFCLATRNHPAGYNLQDGDPAVTINQTSPDFNPDWSGYVNIYVRNIGALGYSPLGGNGNGDGITVDLQAFGSSGNGCGAVTPSAPYDLGRTATHEIGHYLLLYHIWRNDGCGLDDAVADTPLQDDEYYGCPSLGASSCGSNDMHMNYMDYVNDPCMYMFSAGQATRMENYMNSSLANVINNAANVCSIDVSPTCDDGIQNGNETGVDCGGPDCPPCTTCDDGIQNGNETGVDCGGPDCPPCTTCDDGIQNGNETGVDCGGPDCPPCTTCDDGIQNGNETGVDCGGPDCPPCTTCDDGIQNGNETGVDCGGPDCPPCGGMCDHDLTLTIVLDALGSQVTWEMLNDGGSVLASGGPYPNGQIGLVITEMFCLEDGCYTLNIYDSGGNGICCRLGQGSYTLSNDANGMILASGAAFGSSDSEEFCLGEEPIATCDDGIQNGNETGVDCGGPDCAPCVIATCDDGIQNGNETGVDCGGPDCAPCATCDDGIQNGNETGVDCGGPDCQPCVSSDCGPPSGDYVTLTANPRTVIVHWEAEPDASLYELRYRKVGAITWSSRTTSGLSTLLSRLMTSTDYEYQLRSLCPDGWSAWTAVSFFTTNAARMGITQLALQNLYPNPAEGVLYVDLALPLDASVQLTVVDVIGRIVQERTFRPGAGYNILELDLSQLQAGYYQLQIRQNGELLNAKFLKR